MKMVLVFCEWAVSVRALVAVKVVHLFLKKGILNWVSVSLPFTWSGFSPRLFCRNIEFCSACAWLCSPHTSQLPAETPWAPSQPHHTQLPGDKGCERSTGASFGCTQWVTPSLILIYLAGSSWTKDLLSPPVLTLWQIPKRSLEPSWEGRLLLLSPLPSRVFHPPCVLQQLIHKSGAAPKRLRCGGCSPSRADTELSLLLCQHRAAKTSIFS